jgi:hypothetical protein
MIDAIALLSGELNQRVSSFEKRPGVLQIVAPFYHDDGDMQEVFVTPGEFSNTWVLSDYGMTLLRLSYTFDNLSEGRDALIKKIASENGLDLVDGVLRVVSKRESLFFDFMAIQRAITQIMALKFQKSRRTTSSFYEDVRSELAVALAPWKPQFDYHPLHERDDLVIDIQISARRPIFICAAREDHRYLRAGLTCSQLIQHGLSFRSLILVEDEKAIALPNWRTVTNIVDKQYIGKDEILREVPIFVKREVA